MGRYWALRIASYVFKGAGVLVLGYAFVQLFYPVQDWKTGSVDIQFFPHPLLVYQSVDNSEAIMAAIPASRLLHGIFYSLALYAIGQSFSAIFEMKRESEAITRVIMSRLNKRADSISQAPTDPTISVEWQTVNGSRPLGYSRRYRPPSPEVPEDDPRRVRTYRRDPIVRDAPESRIPRPKAKG